MRNDKVQKNTIDEEPDVLRGIKLALRRRSHELGESGSRRAFGQSGGRADQRVWGSSVAKGSVHRMGLDPPRLGTGPASSILP